MTERPHEAPLVLGVHLTDDQRRHILEETGRSIAAVPFESAAPEVRCQFAGLVLRVPRGVFVPVPATEDLLHAAIRSASAFARPTLVDVGTGCGAVALAAAAALPGVSVFATDVSDLALAAARRNRLRLGLRNVRFARGSLLGPLPHRLRGRVAVIAANVPSGPPLLADALQHAFPEGTAIGSGKDGLDLVRALAASAREFLVPGGSLVLQLADFQWGGFGEELVALGYAAPELHEPLTGVAVAGRAVWPARARESFHAR